MTKGGNGNTDLAATAVPDLDRIEHRLAALLRLLETAPVPAEALADAIRVLAGLQAELAATIAAPSWSRGLPAAAPRADAGAAARGVGRGRGDPHHAQA